MNIYIARMHIESTRYIIIFFWNPKSFILILQENIHANTYTQQKCQGLRIANQFRTQILSFR